jgi:hypothetical protein
MQVKLIDSPNDPVRLAFLHVFTKRAGMTNQDGSKSPDKYEATAILKPGGANEKKVKDAIAAVAEEKYGKNWAAMYKDEFADDQRGLRKGDLKKTKGGDIFDGFEGNTYVTAKSDKRPGIYDKDRSVLVADDGKPYSGCFGNVNVDVWALAKQGVKKRIVVSLEGVQFTRDGDAFGAGSNPSKADDFDDLSAADDEGGETNSEGYDAFA